MSFEDTNLYDPPVEVPRCVCSGRISPHICSFGEVPFQLDRVYGALDECTVFMAVGTSGVVEPAASLAASMRDHARMIYVRPEAASQRAFVC